MRGFVDWYGCLTVASVRDGGRDEGSTLAPKKATAKSVSIGVPFTADVVEEHFNHGDLVIPGVPAGVSTPPAFPILRPRFPWILRP